VFNEGAKRGDEKGVNWDEGVFRGGKIGLKDECGV